MALQLFAGGIGTVASYLIFKRFRNLGLLVMSLILMIGSTAAAMKGEWLPLLGCLPLAWIAKVVVGDPLDEG